MVLHLPENVGFVEVREKKKTFYEAFHEVMSEETRGNKNVSLETMIAKAKERSDNSKTYLVEFCRIKQNEAVMLKMHKKGPIWLRLVALNG